MKPYPPSPLPAMGAVFLFREASLRVSPITLQLLAQCQPAHGVLPVRLPLQTRRRSWHTVRLERPPITGGGNILATPSRSGLALQWAAASGCVAGSSPTGLAVQTARTQSHLRTPTTKTAQKPRQAWCGGGLRRPPRAGKAG